MSDLQPATETVQAAIDGDLDAVRAVWQAHRRWVATVLLAHKPRDVELEDLLQDVATTMVRTIDKLRDPGSLKPWLRTTAINAAREAGRSVTRRRRRFRLVSFTGEPSGGDEAPVSSESAQRLLDLASTLPDGYREPLMLRCIQGMSYRQIAEVLGLPVTTVETRITRGRKMLRDLAATDDALADEVGAGRDRKA